MCKTYAYKFCVKCIDDIYEGAEAGLNHHSSHNNLFTPAWTFIETVVPSSAAGGSCPRYSYNWPEV